MKKWIALALLAFATSARAQLATPPLRLLNGGSSLPLRFKLNMTGSGVSCVDNSGAGRTDCTVSGTSIGNFTFSSDTMSLSDTNPMTLLSPNTNSANPGFILNLGHNFGASLVSGLQIQGAGTDIFDIFVNRTSGVVQLIASEVGGYMILDGSGSLFNATLRTSFIDTNTAGALSIGGSNATSVTLGGSFTENPSSGQVTKYNGDSTAGVGLPYNLTATTGVASTGGGAQSTVCATASTVANGWYEARFGILATTNTDVISATMTWTDPNGVVNTKTMFSSLTLTAGATNGTGEVFSFQPVWTGVGTINMTMTLSSHTTTTCGGWITRIK